MEHLSCLQLRDTNLEMNHQLELPNLLHHHESAEKSGRQQHSSHPTYPSLLNQTFAVGESTESGETYHFLCHQVPQSCMISVDDHL